jgi:hypothetical protein
VAPPSRAPATARGCEGRSEPLPRSSEGCPATRRKGEWVSTPGPGWHLTAGLEDRHLVERGAPGRARQDGGRREQVAARTNRMRGLRIPLGGFRRAGGVRCVNLIEEDQGNRCGRRTRAFDQGQQQRGHDAVRVAHRRRSLTRPARRSPGERSRSLRNGELPLLRGRAVDHEDPKASPREARESRRSGSARDDCGPEGRGEAWPHGPCRAGGPCGRWGPSAPVHFARAPRSGAP